MQMTPAAHVISVSQTLSLLDGTFAPLALGVAENQYAFWLGSGISRERVPPLGPLVQKVLEFLRLQVTAEPNSMSPNGKWLVFSAEPTERRDVFGLARINVPKLSR